MVDNSVLSSTPLKFLVGKDEKTFFIHGGLLRNHSEAFRALIDREMSESGLGLVKLPDIDEGTFMSFSEYVYTGNYSEPEPQFTQESYIDESQPSMKNNDRKLQIFLID